MFFKFIQFVLIWGIVTSVVAQEFETQSQYLSGKQESLQIRVHIWGEVSKPGEYLVPDRTNILELISKAGGPTEFARLSNVTITHNYALLGLQQSQKKQVHAIDDAPERIETVNLEKYLRKKNSYINVPILFPGDVVTVKRNMRYNWKYVVQLARDAAIVASVYFWYRRASQE